MELSLSFHQCVLAAGAILLIITITTRLFRRRKRLPLPPGPKPWPLIGNISDLPPTGEQEWIHWLKHKDTYGTISSVTVLGQTIIIINDARCAFDLLEKRSAIHSSRPRLEFGVEMCGWSNMLAVMPNTPRWRAYRKSIHSLFGSKTFDRLKPIQELEVGRFLIRMLNKPKDLMYNIRAESGAIILKTIYGYTIEPHGADPVVMVADKALAQFSRSSVPGAYLVDIIPALRYLPDWFPGTEFKQTANFHAKTVGDFARWPYEFLKRQMAEGKAGPSYLSEMLEKGHLDAEQEHVAKWSATSLFSGGSDTTVSSMACFFLAMTKYPDVQQKAQEELDRVIGSERLPGFDDRENLPYINAAVKETFRYHPVVPLGVPHTSTAEDVYNGFRIPKGAMLMPNIWGFCHDPTLYHDPMNFKPERFLGKDGPVETDPKTLMFGFGRRICPGIPLADSSIYLSIAQALSVFIIAKAVDMNGKEIEPVEYIPPGVISHPVPFEYVVSPRSEKHAALIREFERDHPWTESNAKDLEM